MSYRRVTYPQLDSLTTPPTAAAPPTPPQLREDSITLGESAKLKYQQTPDTPTTGNAFMDIAVSNIQASAASHPTDPNLLFNLASAILECNVDDPAGVGRQWEEEESLVEGIRKEKFAFVEWLFGAVSERGKGEVRLLVEYMVAVLIGFEDLLDGVVVVDIEGEGVGEEKIKGEGEEVDGKGGGNWDGEELFECMEEDSES